MADTALLVPDWPDLPEGIGALASMRQGGASAAPFDDGHGGGGLNLGLHVGDDPATVQANRSRLLGLLPASPAWISQVHGVDVVDAAAVQVDQPAPVADASVASRAGVVCAILTADCLPVLFADLDGKVVGAAHAGWRGLAGGVLATTVAAMRGAGAGAITAWLGPAIGPGRFEVGADVRDSFLAAVPGEARVDAAFAPCPGRPGKYLADLYALARVMLAREGISRVWGGQHCTATERDRFYSFRRDGVTGRQASFIWRK